MTVSVRSQFVTDLQKLDAVATRARLLAARKAVHERIDAITDPDAKLALMVCSDGVDRLLFQTSRLAVEALAEGLAVSHGEEPRRRLPSADPRRNLR
jgi:hypothetical protein